MGEASKAYSRVQLCREFGVTDRTLRELEASKGLDLEWEDYFGMRRVTLTVSQRQILQSAGNHIESFGSATQRTRVMRVPFQRFLFLRMLQLPVDELYDELLEYNLIFPRQFTKDHVQRHRSIFLRNLPDRLRACVEAGKPPETKVEKKQLETTLQVCDIEIFFDNPAKVESFWLLTHPEKKWTLEALLASTSSLKEVQEAAARMTGLSVDYDNLLFYQQLFADYSFLTAEEVQAHLKRMKPSVRNLMLLGIGKPVDSLIARMGFDTEVDREAMLNVVKASLARRVLANMDATDAETRAAFDKDLKSFMLFVDRDEDPKRKPVGEAEAASVFDKLQIIEEDIDSNLFELPKQQSDENVG